MSYHHGDLRNELLTAAVDVARERGIEGLSLRECARRAGVSHAAPYRHFEDKNALLLALADQGFTWLTAAGQRAMEGLDDPRARLDAYGVAYVRFAVTHPIHFRLMFTRELETPTPKTVPEGSPPVANDAFGLLVQTAGAAWSRAGGDALLAGVAAWSIPHGLAMLILDGRIPAEHIATTEAIEQLARDVIQLWRNA
ncbi:MAG: TetR/AcrR family transcriptional regulator [Sandaracinaceae bacterium]|jgi:AcrR family transcriptional regulator|nr:TetR/AcrR family transcriptional regulator [Sandaracinaceae bacterium]MBP7684080.1 TetR/AcrR family transcriptional regulator [Deltaproteobacteria bacterium]MBK7154737.1 TetR/AcrR family transcriptional regulator [Sandaracinaceae bacterium]MBK7776884.1 TetR/AcrR family transcriptional regulator [Sandaracinaceae bacterium]MBK8409646.1 TetR/AcrR family transcriptional regulator [Sandaracinaceae bacterium]